MQEEFNKPAAGAAEGDCIRLRGCFELALMNAANGEVIERRKVDNLVVTVGRKYVLSRIISQSPATDVIGWMAIGTGNVAAASGDTLLGSEVKRLAISTFDVTNLTSGTPNWTAQCTFANTDAITTLGEVGIFNVSTANSQTMLARATFATFSKATTNTLAISYTISN